MKNSARTVETLKTMTADRRPVRAARQRPRLRLTPFAWAKLTYLRDEGPTEIGGFGISAPGCPLLIEDVALVRQRCDWASVALDDEAVADFFDRMVDAGRRPEEFGRVWVHTHPGDSAQPSATDEETFARVFGGCQWSVMFIVAKRGAAYARLAFGVGPGGELEVPMEVEFCAAFPGADPLLWRAEYDACVQQAVATATSSPRATGAWDEFDMWSA
jgi:hypothetical protein